jgi:hypothetical protein
VQRADAVDVRRGAHRQRRHVELCALAVVELAQGKEALAMLSQFAPATG